MRTSFMLQKWLSRRRTFGILYKTFSVYAFVLGALCARGFRIGFCCVCETIVVAFMLTFYPRAGSCFHIFIFRTICPKKYYNPLILNFDVNHIIICLFKVHAAVVGFTNSQFDWWCIAPVFFFIYSCVCIEKNLYTICLQRCCRFDWVELVRNHWFLR